MALPSLVLTMVLAVATSAPSDRASDLRFGRLTMDDGLSQTWVYAVLRDSRGFLWVATQTGVDRYDGERFINYLNRSMEAPGFGGTSRALLEDSSGRIWVSTTRGLLRFDRALDRFEWVPLGEGGAANRVGTLAEDRAGRLWVPTGDGLAVLDQETGAVTRHRARPEEKAALPSSEVTHALASRTGRIWYGTPSDGLGYVDPETGRVTRLPLDSDPRGRGFGGFGVDAMHEDATGRVWVGSFALGLVGFDGATGRIVAHHVPDPDRPGTLGTRRVRALESDAEGQLFVGTENGGLEVLDTRTGVFRRFLPRKGDESSLGSPSIYSLSLDQQGILWIGTFNAGLNFTSSATRRFRSIRAIRQDELGDPHVSAILEDDRGDLWVGTDGGGIDRFLKASGRVVRYRHDPRNQATLASNAVLAVIQDSGGAIWVGGWDLGLNLLDADTGRVTRFAFEGTRQNVMAILEDSPTELLLSTQGGVVVFDRVTRTARDLAERFPGVPTTYGSIAVRDSRGRLWMGTDRGVTVLEPGGAVRELRYDPSNPATIARGTVVAIREGSEGEIWLGSEGGLTLLTPSGGLRRFGPADGLPSFLIRDVIEDESSNLWVSTDSGLARIERESLDEDVLRALTFDAADGLAGLEFKNATAYRSKSGELFFGGHLGLTRFFPRDIVENPVPPPVVFTGLRLANRPVLPGAAGSVLARSMTETTSLTLAHRQNVISFDFAALDMLAPTKNRYRYRLDGLEPEWNEAGGNGTASYAGLPPGRYTLRVKAANNDGVWNEEGVSLALRILPPLYLRWYSIVLYILALVAALAYGYRWRVRSMEERRRELEGVVAQRTAELEASAEDLQRQGDALALENEERKRAEGEALRAAAAAAESNRDLERQRKELEREVGERQRAEEEAGRERDLLHALMDNATDLIYFKDTRSRYTRVNEAMAAALGVSGPAEAVGRWDFDFHPEAYARLARRDEERVLETGQPLVGHVEHDEKRGLWYQTTKVPIRDSRGSVAGLVGISVDITERKQAEERLERELGAFLGFVDEVARGDLSRRGAEGGDTLGRIGKGVNAMLSSFGGILTTVRDTIHSVSSGSAEILAAATQISKGAEHGSDQVQDVLVAVEEMSASMVTVSRDAEASASAARLVLDHVREGESAVNAAHDGMARIDLAVGETAQKMKLLEKRSREVFEVIDLIQDIASQSELLSLNAAIQAAHAGEAGRGFSVVADEIRRLAERSRTATRSVSVIVEGIVEEIRGAIEAMGIALTEVNAERGLSDRARGALGEIGGLVDDSATRAGQISLAAREQAQTTHSMAEAMQSLASISTESAAGARETAKSVAQLVKLAEDLDESITRFRLE